MREEIKVLSVSTNFLAFLYLFGVHRASQSVHGVVGQSDGFLGRSERKTDEDWKSKKKHFSFQTLLLGPLLPGPKISSMTTFEAVFTFVMMVGG